MVHSMEYCAEIKMKSMKNIFREKLEKNKFSFAKRTYEQSGVYFFRWCTARFINDDVKAFNVLLKQTFLERKLVRKTVFYCALEIYLPSLKPRKAPRNEIKTAKKKQIKRHKFICKLKIYIIVATTTAGRAEAARFTRLRNHKPSVNTIIQD